MARSETDPRAEVDPVPLPDPHRIRAYQRTLCDWYHTSRRDLPWRRRGDAYAIWISESMLQQTRVETVVPYYERFLERFPDVAALARGAEEEVLALWSGLGYYRRARALHAAAREIVASHDGEFPRDRRAVLELPGIGPYTAGAVLSMAFGVAEPLVDGNVARVFARLFGLAAPLRSPALEQALWRLAEALVPEEAAPGGIDPGSWNQAVMELGATICVPKRPRCSSCPLRELCLARAAGRVEELPIAAPKRATVDVELEMLLVRRRGRVLLVQRPATGRMAGLWELPTREIANGRGETLLWPAEHAPTGLSVADGDDELSLLKHAITHHRIRASVRHGVFAQRGTKARPGSALQWCFGRFVGAELQERPLALTGLTRKALRRAVASGTP